jgi:hypothetical protein
MVSNMLLTFKLFISMLHKKKNVTSAIWIFAVNIHIICLIYNVTNIKSFAHCSQFSQRYLLSLWLWLRQHDAGCIHNVITLVLNMYKTMTLSLLNLYISASAYKDYLRYPEIVHSHSVYIYIPFRVIDVYIGQDRWEKPKVHKLVCSCIYVLC